MCRGSYKRTWVELTRRYANHHDRPDILATTSERLAAPRAVTTGRTAPYEADTATRGRQHHVRAALTDEQKQEILWRFARGEPKHRLAVEYGMSLSTMKRLLKATRDLPRPVA
jgi:hypothetical protein